MTSYYMDTSAIAKRYVAEIGSTWMRQLVDPQQGHAIIVCDLTPVEFVSLLTRHQRESRLSASDVALYEAAYLTHHNHEYLSMILDADVLVRARALLKSHSLKALDAVHLSCALEAAHITGIQPVFVSGDKQLLTAAAGEGLVTDNPLNHP